MMRERVEPFLALMDARYAPLLFAVAPQAYAVYLWLWDGSDGSTEAAIFAVLGALGYELVYVGAIAWTEHRHRNAWTTLTAVIALFFSVAVAVYVYRDQGAAAWLHGGFPLVAFAYTMAMHRYHQRDAGADTLSGQDDTPPPVPTVTTDMTDMEDKSVGYDLDELKRHYGSVTKAAAAMGISRQAVYARRRKG